MRPEGPPIPPIPPAPPPARRCPPCVQVLQHEQQYLRLLPLTDMYEKSYMHRDMVTSVVVAAGTGFFITASLDGFVKFWKKQPQGIEFAKQYKAHLGPITALAVSSDNTLCASISTDRSVKVGRQWVEAPAAPEGRGQPPLGV